MTPPQKLSRLVPSETTIRSLHLLVGAVAIGFIIWRLQFSTHSICCGDFDGYYHIMWSRMLWDAFRSHHRPPSFTWLPLTTLNPKDYVDHHFLFHVLQIPFTWFRDLRLGAKVAATIFASLAIFSCYWLMVRYRIRYVLVWLVALLACSTPFLFRMNMAKAPPLTIIYLILGIHLLFQKKYWPLLPFAFLFTLTYDLFVLLIAGAVIWALVLLWTEHRLEWRPLVFILVGVIAGLVINPYFPHNLYLLFEHAKVKLAMGEFATKVGGEWYPYDTWTFVGNSAVACVAMVVGYVAFDSADRKRAHQPLFFLLFSTMLLVMAARWQRMMEYWPPFAVMFAAFSLQPWLEGAHSIFTRLPPDVLDELKPFLDRQGPLTVLTETRELVQMIGAAVVAILLGAVLFVNLDVTRKDISSSETHEYYRSGIQWMRSNVPSGDIVFNTDWDDFPRLFYFDPTHRYVSGLDPTYLYDRNSDLSQVYERIGLGKETDPGPLIRDRFGARYVFSDNFHSKFYANAMSSGWFEVAYEDNDCTVLHIRDQKLQNPEKKNEEPSDDDNGDDDGDNGGNGD
jgi:hypothetical protein